MCTSDGRLIVMLRTALIAQPARLTPRCIVHVCLAAAPARHAHRPVLLRSLFRRRWGHGACSESPGLFPAGCNGWMACIGGRD